MRICGILIVLEQGKNELEVLTMMFGGGMIIVWLILLAGGYFFIKLLMDNQKSANTNDDALAILQRRYASGDINQAEFLKREKDIIDSHK